MPGTKPSRYCRALPYAGAALGFAAVLVATHRYGPGVSHDSVAYLHASRSLLEGRGFEYFGYPGPYIQWPPLFPTLLAAAGLFGADPAAASRWLNAAAHAAIIAYGGILLGRRLQHRACAIVGVLLLVFSAPLIEVSKYVWTETIFILLFLAFFDAFERYRATRRPALLVWAALFSALAWLDRYLGVTVVMTATIFLLLEKRAFLERFKNTLLYGVVSSAPMLVWMGRNYLVSGTLAGVRVPSPYTLSVNLKLTAAAFATWIPSAHRVWAASLLTATLPAITVSAAPLL